MSHKNQRQLESTIHTELDESLTYSDYLGLDTLLQAQRPQTMPEHPDEMLFIVQHQVSELWMKLLIHELENVDRHLVNNLMGPCLKSLARIKQIQQQLFEQWSVLETLTPVEYASLRPVLGKASGFQSLQYRLIEFMLGNKNSAMLKVFSHDMSARNRLQEALEKPSIYQQFLFYLERNGFQVSSECLPTDCSMPHQRNEKLLPVFRQIYQQREQHWDAYDFCEKLVDVEEYFQLWRFRHMKMVERVIGFKSGTGGSSGVAFLRKALDLVFFPELFDVRTELESI